MDFPNKTNAVETSCQSTFPTPPFPFTRGRRLTTYFVFSNRLKFHLKAIGCVVNSTRRLPGKRKAGDVLEPQRQMASLQVPLPPDFVMKVARQ